eukprot:SAG22_NODE_880_length_6703_cov_8.753786_7_plen_169_part_00
MEDVKNYKPPPQLKKKREREAKALAKKYTSLDDDMDNYRLGLDDEIEEFPGEEGGKKKKRQKSGGEGGKAGLASERLQPGESRGRIQFNADGSMSLIRNAPAPAEGEGGGEEAGGSEGGGAGTEEAAAAGATGVDDAAGGAGAETAEAEAGAGGEAMQADDNAEEEEV